MVTGVGFWSWIVCWSWILGHEGQHSEHWHLLCKGSRLGVKRWRHLTDTFCTETSCLFFSLPSLSTSVSLHHRNHDTKCFYCDILLGPTIIRLMSSSWLSHRHHFYRSNIDYHVFIMIPRMGLLLTNKVSVSNPVLSSELSTPCRVTNS